MREQRSLSSLRNMAGYLPGFGWVEVVGVLTAHPRTWTVKKKDGSTVTGSVAVSEVKGYPWLFLKVKEGKVIDYTQTVA